MAFALPEPDVNRELTFEERKIVARVCTFLEMEYEYLRSINPTGDLSPLSNVLKRTAEATGVTEYKVTQCVEEFAEELKGVKVFEPPKPRNY